MTKVKQATSPMIPGEVVVASDDIEINVGRKTMQVVVMNVGDRPIQVGSHYHFYEVNEALVFEREASRGYRPNIPAGTAIRFEPGQKRTIELVEYAGKRQIFGFQGKIMGKL